MKYLTLFLLITSVLLNADYVKLKTDIIDQQRQSHIDALSIERDLLHTNRLHILKERDQAARLGLDAKRLKRHNHIAYSNLKCWLQEN